MIRWVSAYTKCLVTPVSSVGGTKDFNMLHVISAERQRWMMKNH